MSSKERLKSVLEDVRASGKINTDALKYLTEQEKDTIYDLYNEGLVNDALQFIEDLDTDQEWQALREKMAASKNQALPLWKSLAKYAAVFIGFLVMVHFFRIEEKADTETQIIGRIDQIKSRRMMP